MNCSDKNALGQELVCLDLLFPVTTEVVNCDTEPVRIRIEFSLTDRDFDRVVTISTHIEQTTAQMGATRLRSKAEQLRTAVLSESELLEILQMAQELTHECRQLNQSAIT